MNNSKENFGYLNSIQSMGGVDGPGIRVVLFFQGCPLRCIYCHNPETWVFEKADKKISVDAIISKILRFKPYFIRDGGVTLSGGEPLLQAEFCESMLKALKKENIHTAIDTSGCYLPPNIKNILKLCDLVILDIKFTDSKDYKKYTQGDFSKSLELLHLCEKLNVPVWIRQVIIPDINDNKANLKELAKIIVKSEVVERVELLPFKNICQSKYDDLKIKFPLEGKEPMDKEKLKELKHYLKKIVNNNISNNEREINISIR